MQMTISKWGPCGGRCCSWMRRHWRESIYSDQSIIMMALPVDLARRGGGCVEGTKPSTVTTAHVYEREATTTATARRQHKTVDGRWGDPPHRAMKRPEGRNLALGPRANRAAPLTSDGRALSDHGTGGVRFVWRHGQGRARHGMAWRDMTWQLSAEPCARSEMRWRQDRSRRRRPRRDDMRQDDTRRHEQSLAATGTSQRRRRHGVGSRHDGARQRTS
jgi:hypothetical protein